MYGAFADDIRYNDISEAGLLCNDNGLIYVWGRDGKGTRIAYNWIYNNRSQTNPGIYLDNYCSNFIVHHNVIWNCEAGVRVNAPARGHQVYNNTLFNCRDIGTHTYNQWPNHTPAYWTENGYGNIHEFATANNLFLNSNPDAQLADAGNRKFWLKEGAPAIDAGQHIPGFTDGFAGTAPDLGAYESGWVDWVPGKNGRAAQPPASGNATHDYLDSSGTRWRAHIFTEVGTNTFTVTRGGNVEVLVVAGGGGGGRGTSDNPGGGGGAGGLIITNLTLSSGASLDVVVGAGGAGGAQDNSGGENHIDAENGQNSSFHGIVATGGGSGGRFGRDGTADGNAGGSGGGGGAWYEAGTTNPGGTGTPSQGTNGGTGIAGDGNSASRRSGGGGGAGSSGSTSPANGTGGGGAGISLGITGTTVVYARGGHGAAGGANVAGSPGMDGRGNGGNAARVGASDPPASGRGGSGIVVLRYRLPLATMIVIQ